MRKKFLVTTALCAAMMIAMTACGSKTDTTTTETVTETTTVAEIETTTVAKTESSEVDDTIEETSSEADATDESKTLVVAEPTDVKISGEFSVDVPDGFEFSIGDTFDADDTRYFSVKKSSFAYFDFSADGEENIRQHYDYNKNTYTNEQIDFKQTYGNVEWEGFQYGDGFGGYGFEAYATIDGTMIRVSSAGFKFDADEAKTVLSSVKHTADNTTDAIEAFETVEDTEATTSEVESTDASE